MNKFDGKRIYKQLKRNWGYWLIIQVRYISIKIFKDIKNEDIYNHSSDTASCPYLIFYIYNNNNILFHFLLNLIILDLVSFIMPKMI